MRSVSGVLPGSDLPGAVLPNAELADLVEEVRAEYRRREVDADVPPCSAAFPEERLGIRSRRVLDEHLSTRDLAVEAARRALSGAGVAPRHVRAVLVATVTPDRVVPALATTVAHALDLPPSVTAFDLTLGCNGFLAALDVASRLLGTCPEGAAALVVGADTMLRVLDAADRTTCPVFGDGAGAVMLQRAAGARLLPVHTTTLGIGGARIEIRPAARPELPLFRIASRGGAVRLREERTSRQVVAMQGRRVFRDMVRTVPGIVRRYLEAYGLAVGDVDRFAFHQANARLIDAIASAPELELPPARLLRNIEHVANTTSASVPLLLAQALREERLRPGERVVLVGFGTGYSVGITSLTWNG